MKDYERYGIPENIWLEYDNPPDFAEIYDLEEDSLRDPHGLIPGDFRLWGSADYWTPLEAALLFAGVSPDNDDLYLVTQEIVPDIGFGSKYKNWEYAYEFEKAKDFTAVPLTDK